MLRLYVASATPNSARAQSNLQAALKAIDGGTAGLNVEVIDVFEMPKRAMNDGVIVTPTLIGLGAGGRQTLLGDLSDTVQLRGLLDAVRG
jgi:circadian clock protein KaiB